MGRLHFLIATALGLFGAASANAECAPEFAQPAQTVTLNAIEVGSGKTVRENFNVRVQNDETGPCEAVIRVVKTNGFLNGSHNFILESGPQVIQVLSNISAAGGGASDLQVSGIGNSSVGRSVPITITMPTEWGLTSGTTTEEYSLLLFDQRATLLDTMTLYVRFEVFPAVELRIVGVTGASEIAQMDLGILEPDRLNMSDPFALRVWSTSGYSVAFESQNLGVLRHRSQTDRIPYMMLMNGNEVDLRGAITTYFSQPSDAMGNLHPLQINVLPFEARSGEYSDRVTVTVSAS